MRAAAPLALVALAAVLVLPGLGARDLWNPNEPAYGVAVREMHDADAWLLPTIEGRPFAEKPIGLFWLCRVTALLTGTVDEWSLRLPVALAVVAAVPLLWLLVRRHAGRERALLAGALFATTFMTWWGARQLQMDSLVMVTTLAAVLAATSAVEAGGAAWGRWALAGAAVGLGVLVKGPVASVLPAAIVTFDTLLARRRVSIAGGMLAAATALAIAAPWFAALALAGRDEVLRELVVRQNVTRMIDPWDHAQPWWYYLKYVWIDMAPWAWFAPLALALPGRGDGERRLERLAWVWIAVVIGVFSLSASKRSAYILPLAPAVAILAAATFDRLLRGALPAWRRRVAQALIAASAAGMLLAAALLVTRVAVRYPGLDPQARLVAAWCGACGVAVLLAFGSARRRVAAPAALFVFVAGLEALAGAAVLPAVDPYKSARRFAGELSATIAPDEPLAAYRLWEWRAEYAFYGAPSMLRIETPETLAEFAGGPGRRWLLVEDGRLPEALDVIGEREPFASSRIGSRTASLFAVGAAVAPPRAPGP